MRVGWLVAAPDYIGGAELTEAEFRKAAPEDVETIDCPPGGVVQGLDRYVLQNCVPYSMDDMRAIGSAPTWKYVHDLWPDGHPDVRAHILSHARLMFCSPLHLERFRHPIGSTAIRTIPPAVDKATFRPTRQIRRNGKRSGVCSIAGWRNPGKGGQYILEYAQEHGPIDVYGGGGCVPHGPNLTHMGELEPGRVAQTLWKYETFCFLPTDLEPFCRTVAEAHFAGLKVTTNKLVGATHWLENDPGAIDSAASDFWGFVLDG